MKIKNTLKNHRIGGFLVDFFINSVDTRNMNFHVITLFPDMFSSYLEDSMLARAKEAGLLRVSFYNPRYFSDDKHNRVDDRPYGGGPGMVMQAEPILRAVESARSTFDAEANVKTIIFSPGGEMFTNDMAEVMKTDHTDIILICGRYEGIDRRVQDILEADLVSIGDYVLTGGELPALVVIDAVTRRIPGVLGKMESLEELRVSSHDTYTRPEVLSWQGNEYPVPEVLLSGHHAEIDKWREGADTSS